MYTITRKEDPKYGNVIEVTREGTIETPFYAVLAAKKDCRLWKESGARKVRFLVDGQILNLTELEKWAREEYQSLPKCHWCVKILDGDVYTHRLSGDRLFCRQDCADRDYAQEMEHMTDYEEFDL